MRVRVLSVIGVAASVAGVAACTYDFTVAKKPPPSDASVDSDAGAGANDGGASGADGGDGGAPAADGAPEFSCSELTVGLAQLRDEATACSTNDPDACLTTLRDECNCEFGVGQPNSPMALGYGATLEKYRDAGCTPASCKPCPPAPDFFCGDTGQPHCKPF